MASRPKLDLADRRFGKLTAVSFHDRVPKGTKGKHMARWFCRCDCGGERIVRRGDLVDGNTTSCGCAADAARAQNLVKARVASRSPEGRAKLSLAQRRRWQRPEERLAHSERMKRVPMTPEWRAAIEAGKARYFASRPKVERVRKYRPRVTRTNRVALIRRLAQQRKETACLT